MFGQFFREKIREFVSEKRHSLGISAKRDKRFKPFLF